MVSGEPGSCTVSGRACPPLVDAKHVSSCGRSPTRLQLWAVPDPSPVVGGLLTAHASVNRTNLHVTHFLVREVRRSGEHPATEQCGLFLNVPAADFISFSSRRPLAWATCDVLGKQAGAPDLRFPRRPSKHLGDIQRTAWFKKGSGTVAGTARRVPRTTVYRNRSQSEVLYDGPPRPSIANQCRRPRRAIVQVPAVPDRERYT